MFVVYILVLDSPLLQSCMHPTKLRLGHAAYVQLLQASSRVLLCTLTRYDSMTKIHASILLGVIVCELPCFGTSFSPTAVPDTRLSQVL